MWKSLTFRRSDGQAFSFFAAAPASGKWASAYAGENMGKLADDGREQLFVVFVLQKDQIMSAILSIRLITEPFGLR